MIDRDADRALYKQLADLLREKINSGGLTPGDLLPSEAYIGQTYGISTTAVRRALEVLLNEGLVTKGRGRRTQVRERPQREIVRLRRGDEVDTRMPTDRERRRLGIPVGEPVFELRRHGRKVQLVAGASTTLRVS